MNKRIELIYQTGDMDFYSEKNKVVHKQFGFFIKDEDGFYKENSIGHQLSEEQYNRLVSGKRSPLNPSYITKERSIKIYYDN